MKAINKYTFLKRFRHFSTAAWVPEAAFRPEKPVGFLEPRLTAASRVNAFSSKSP